uniref:NADP-dependent oxidoreductase domain-containing protein n=1 Tax=Oryza brachyantha TaxID=4533 RepID=J3LYB2_ORYBR
MARAVPEVALQHGDERARPMPAVGMGTAEFPVVPDRVRSAVLAAIEVGYRHFRYATEAPLGEAVAEAVRRGVVASREEVFVTTKVWCTKCHPDLVLPSLQESLRNLQMEYVDLYLVHMPISLKPEASGFPLKKEDVVPFDFEGVWRAMEECHRLGLAKAIGVSNFTTKHLDKLLAEMSPVWRQRTVREYCATKGIHVTAYSPLGGQNWGGHGNDVMGSPVLAEIAEARGKSIAQVSLRWIYEQGVTPIAKSYNKERLKQNLEIFDWELTEEDHLKISQIHRRRFHLQNCFLRMVSSHQLIFRTLKLWRSRW